VAPRLSSFALAAATANIPDARRFLALTPDRRASTLQLSREALRRVQECGGGFPTFFVSCPLPRRNVNRAVEDVVRAEVEALGYELFELRQGGSKGRPVLDVRIDRRDGEKVTVEDCARASRAIEARLDEGDVLGERYVLEVSSPGVERPLRNAAEWRRYVGRRAAVKSEVVPGGRAEVEILGVEGEPESEVALLRDDRGVELRVPLAAVREARLAFQWQR